MQKTVLGLNCLLFLVGVLPWTRSEGSIVFYGGDSTTGSSANAFDSWINRDTGFGLLCFDDFDVAESGTVTRLWSHAAFSFDNENTITSAHYEIRTGVGPGSGGTLVASGTVPAVCSPTGRIIYAPSPFSRREYEISLPVSLNLTAGTYWLAIAPLTTRGTWSGVFASLGANAIGSPIGNGNSYFSSDLYSYWNWVPLAKYWGTEDLSYGLEMAPVPEPSTYLAGALMLLPFGIQGLRCLRNRR